jgi:MFS family permease
LSGVLLAVVSAGGVLSGVVFGRSTVDRVSDIGQYVASAFIVGVGVIGFVVLPTIIGSVVSALLVGIGMTPMFILAYVLVDKVVPSRYHTEVNAALGSGYNLGDGVATVALGFVIAAAGTNNALLAVAVVVIALSCLGLLLKAPATSE